MNDTAPPNPSPDNGPVQDRDYEILVLLAMEYLGGKPRRADVLRFMEREMMPQILLEHPEEGQGREGGVEIWKNKASFAREYLKRRRQLSMPSQGVWAITDLGCQRLHTLRELVPSLSVSDLRKLKPGARAGIHAELIKVIAELREEGGEF